MEKADGHPRISPSTALLAGALAGLLVAEILRPLRKQTQPKLRRDARNLALGAASALTVHLLERPVVRALTKIGKERRLGLLPQLRLPPAFKFLLGVLLLDYTLYLWHVLTHKVPFLWKFHAIHHSDLDLDASTGIRFHFGEIAISVLWRGAQVLLIGPTPGALRGWQIATLIAVLFHHSNWKLPADVDERLSRLLVSPAMHGIHHSIEPAEMNSNWSSLFSIWDGLHGTARRDVAQDEIVIGIRDFRDPEQLNLAGIALMPFRPEPPVAFKRLSVESDG